MVTITSFLCFSSTSSADGNIGMGSMGDCRNLAPLGGRERAVRARLMNTNQQANAPLFHRPLLVRITNFPLFPFE